MIMHEISAEKYKGANIKAIPEHSIVLYRKVNVRVLQKSWSAECE